MNADGHTDGDREDDGEDAVDRRREEGILDHINESSLYMDRGIAPLLRNDPTVTKVHAEPFPPGYGQHLGPALVHNTVVTDLTLNLSTLCAEENTDWNGVGKLLTFVAESSSLRLVDVYDQDGEDRELVKSIAGQLVRAVARNAGIEKVQIWASLPSHDFAEFLRTSRSVTDLNVFLEQLAANDEDRLVVAQAFLENQTLETFQFYTPSESETARLVLMHLPTHPTLRKLLLHSFDEPSFTHVQMIATFLRSGTKIEELVLRNYTFDVERLEHLVAALSASRQLETLSLAFCKFDDDAAHLFIEFVQRGIAATSIRELEMDREAYSASTFGNIVVADWADAISNSLPTVKFLGSVHGTELVWRQADMHADFREEENGEDREVGNSVIDDDQDIDEVEDVDEVDEDLQKILTPLRCSDPAISTVNASSYRAGYSHDLGPAIVNNTVVKELSLNLSNLCSERNGDMSGIEDLLSLVSESSTLRVVKFFGWDGEQREVVIDLGGEFLKRIADNVSIQQVRSFVTLRACDFARFLRCTRSVTYLDVFLEEVVKDDADRFIVAQAFIENQTLETLSCYATPSSEIMRLVLTRLPSHPALLELSLNSFGEPSMADIQMIATFLRSQTKIQILCFHIYTFDQERLEHLVAALSYNQSLQKLSFSSCDFEVDATNHFIAFIQKGISATNIRELEINKGCSFDARTIGSIAATFLPGSPLQHLGILGAIDDMELLFHKMESEAAEIKLPCLRLRHVDIADVFRLFLCLPKLWFLRELAIVVGLEANPQGIVIPLVSMIRLNGSLRQVSLEDTDGKPLFNKRLNRMARASCQRNEFIPVLVANPRVDHCSDDSVEKVDLSLFPRLFVGFPKKARQSRVTTLLSGLLAASEAFGVHNT
jgi:hypothetical protein